MVYCWCLVSHCRQTQQTHSTANNQLQLQPYSMTGERGSNTEGQEDPSHPGHKLFKMLPSGGCHELCVHKQ